MKNPTLLIKISLFLFVVAFALTIGEFLALHDIWNDYVSVKVIESHRGINILNLPEWSETKLEWQMVNISALVQVLYLLFSLVTLVSCLKALRKN